jgi:signal transduction histidine kinase
MTDKDYWISILDDGIGLSDAPKNMFEVGKTSKKEHPGFGLAIAKQAMDTLDGTLSLAPYSGRGAKYEMRWRINT